MDEDTHKRLRALPSVQEVLDRAEIAAAAGAELPEPDVKAAVREAIDAKRQALLEGADPSPDARISSEEVLARARRISEPSLIPVINATGVVVHTNLGRSPLPRPVLEQLLPVACGYSNLEYDLDRGGRGHRHAHAGRLLARVTGAEDALVVNNCAAAVLLCLTTLARSREVIVSRGEEVEIGGSFRVPDVMRQSGATLVEVGTTNRTRLADYEAAVGPDTGLLLKVHRSNFAVVGFTEEVSLAELAALGRARGVPTMMDLGSGMLARPVGAGFHEELTVSEVLEAGIDVVTFSGDKLLGGPQAGIIAGQAAVIQTLVRHPLLRALRPDKLTFAALQGVLALHAADRASVEIPTLRMIHDEPEAVAARRAELRQRLAGLTGDGRSPDAPVGELALQDVDLPSTPGGGSSPLTRLPSSGLALTCPHRSAEQLATQLRRRRPPVIGRIEDDRLLLDLRTVLPESLDELAIALADLAARRG
jgi:L-seryl-tRNA(Ser) seleniumtransferase